MLSLVFCCVDLVVGYFTVTNRTTLVKDVSEKRVQDATISLYTPGCHYTSTIRVLYEYFTSIEALAGSRTFLRVFSPTFK